MFLSTIASKQAPASALVQLIKAVKDGLGIPESAIQFSFSYLCSQDSGLSTTIPINGTSREFKIEGDVFIVKAMCLDMALWKVGGAAVALRLVQLANVSQS
jgi:hypothetical protein